MHLNEKKTKATIVNFTKKYQFTARLKLNNTNIEIVDSMKILGTTLNNQLNWDQNCKDIIRKVLEQAKAKWSTCGYSTADLFWNRVLFCGRVD